MYLEEIRAVKTETHSYTQSRYFQNNKNNAKLQLICNTDLYTVRCIAIIYQFG